VTVIGKQLLLLLATFCYPVLVVSVFAWLRRRRDC